MSGSPINARALLERAGLRAKKSWGQNFLRDDEVLADIARASRAGPERPVVELGAGLGALTYHLLERGGRVIAVERDREIVPLLRENLATYERLEIREANAAELDYAAFAAELGGPLTVVGNLPYQLSSRILVELADAQPHVARAVLMVQREVAERLEATPGGRDYGLLTVLVQRAFWVGRVRDVPPGAFHPPPKVHSAVIELELRKDLRSRERDARLVLTARAAFSQRRKMLRNSIAMALDRDSREVEAALRRAGIDPGLRAEKLGIDELERLGEALEIEAART